MDFTCLTTRFNRLNNNRQEKRIGHIYKLYENLLREEKRTKLIG